MSKIIPQFENSSPEKKFEDKTNYQLFVHSQYQCDKPVKGSSGKNGSVPETTPSLGKDGLPGEYFNMKHPDISVVPSPDWMTAILHSAEIQLINGDLSPALEKLEFLCRTIISSEKLIKETVVSKAPLSDISLIPHPALARGKLAEESPYKLIYTKCLNLIQQMSKGQDPYGRNINYVPLLSYSYIRKYVEALLDSATAMESKAEELERYYGEQEQTTSSLASLITETNSVIKQLQNNIDSFSDKTNVINNQVQDLHSQLQVLYSELMAAEDDYIKAVEEESDGCEYVKVLTFVAMVATVVATGGAAVGLIAAASSTFSTLTAVAAVAGAAVGAIEASEGRDDTISDVNHGYRVAESACMAADSSEDPTQGCRLNAEFGFSELKEDAETLGKIVKPAGRKFREFQVSYAKAEKAISEYEAAMEQPSVPGATRLPRDHVKLIARKSDFDKSIAPYMKKFKEARRYKRLMDTYVSLAETRNNKIIEHDVMVGKITQARSEIALNNYSIDVISSEGIRNFDFTLTRNKAFIDTMLISVKSNIVKGLSDLAKSVEFADPGSGSIFVNDFSIAALKATLAEVNASYMDAQQKFASSPINGTDIRFNLRELLTPKMEERFLNGEDVIFSLPQISGNEELSGVYGAKTKKIRFALSDALKNITFSAIFEHQGRSSISDIKGNVHTYSHEQVRALHAVTAGNEPNFDGTIIPEYQDLTGNNTWVGVSPYGPWKLAIIRGDTNARAALLEADISLDIYGRPIDI